MRDLLGNISWLAAASLAVKPLWFIFITAFCMRLLGVDGYGVFSSAIALAMIASGFTDLGVARYTAREIGRDKASASLFFSNFFALRMVAVVAAAAVAVVVAMSLDYRGRALAAVLFACGYTMALQLTNYCRTIFEAFERLRLEAGLLLLEKTLVIGGGLTALVATRAPHWTLAGMAAGMALATAVNALYVSFHLAPFRPSLFDRRFVVRSLRSMIPLGLGGLFTLIYYRVDLVMIEAMLGETAAGQYGVAYRIFEALSMVTAVVVIAGLFPRLSRLRGEGDFEAFAAVFSRGQMALTFLSLGIATGVAFSAPSIIRILSSDPGFGPAVGVLRILVWAFPLLCANSLLYSALVALDDDRFTAWILGGAVLANVATNVILIPLLGINGAAIATIVPEVGLIGVYTLRYLYRRHELFPL